jgi:hypothetical protein
VWRRGRGRITRIRIVTTAHKSLKTIYIPHSNVHMVRVAIQMVILS